jgi:predicted phosphoribosyltransferase
VEPHREGELSARDQHASPPAFAEPPHQTAILVDDGPATGSTMKAAMAALRQLQPARIVVAA